MDALVDELDTSVLYSSKYKWISDSDYGAISTVKKLLALAYSLTCYLIFIGAFLYAIGFVGDFVVSKSINTGKTDSIFSALFVDGCLIALFGIQHSLMARATFKTWWTNFISKTVERSTYVLFASLLLDLWMWQWQPMPQMIWDVNNEAGFYTLTALVWLGWSIVLLSTFLIDHFELFGLQQVYRCWRHKPLSSPAFRTPILYKIVRHPMMTGLLIAFWVTPHMTIGHAVFALGMTVYIVIGIQYEERDLMRAFGDTYQNYRRTTSMVLPIPHRTPRQSKPAAVESVKA